MEEISLNRLSVWYWAIVPDQFGFYAPINEIAVAGWVFSLRDSRFRFCKFFYALELNEFHAFEGFVKLRLIHSAMNGGGSDE